MERRFSSCLSCSADRRDRRLLRRLSPASRSRRAGGGQGIRLSGRAVAAPQGRKARQPTSALPATAFVNFLQNHDQIGNRAPGERLSVLAEPAALEAALAVTLLAPPPPLMFMGDEWGAREPFPFFCDFKGDLADAVRNGRRRNSPKPTRGTKTRCPIRCRKRLCNLPSSIGRLSSDPNIVRASISCSGCSRRENPSSPLACRNFSKVPAMPSLRTAYWWHDGPSPQAKLCRCWPISANGHARVPMHSRKPVWGGVPPAELPPWLVYAAIEG